MNVKPEAETRYHAALELYSNSRLSVKEICRRTQTPLSAFQDYIWSARRELMFARHGISITHDEAQAARLRKPQGQTAAAHAKYKDAIAACDNMSYIGYNVSQIAGIFNLRPTSLNQQLRVHYPEILKRREKERQRLGLNDNIHRGAKQWCREQYADAVEHLRTTDDTIRQTALLYNISYPGLREHLLYYHKDIVNKRADRRRRSISVKKRGTLTGSGTRHEPSARQVEKYREAVKLYRTTAMTQKEIAAATRVSLNGLRNHLRIWYPELILEHRGVKCGKSNDIKISDTKHYLKTTTVKYAEAIRQLKATGEPTAKIAREFGLNPETFRAYLHEHEPKLASRLGMTRLADGRRVSARSMDKYAEAIRLYETTDEPLHAIVSRLGLVYNSIFSFMHRNCPEAAARHKALRLNKK